VKRLGSAAVFLAACLVIGSVAVLAYTASLGYWGNRQDYSYTSPSSMSVSSSGSDNHAFLHAEAWEVEGYSSCYAEVRRKITAYNYVPNVWQSDYYRVTADINVDILTRIVSNSYCDAYVYVLWEFWVYDDSKLWNKWTKVDWGSAKFRRDGTVYVRSDYTDWMLEAGDKCYLTVYVMAHSEMAPRTTCGPIWMRMLMCSTPRWRASMPEGRAAPTFFSVCRGKTTSIYRLKT